MTGALLRHSERLHTTELGARRIGKDLGIGEAEAVAYCRKLLEENDCVVFRRGKNLYYEAVGLEVIRLKRVAFGPVRLGMLRAGDYRELKKEEIAALRGACGKK